VRLRGRFTLSFALAALVPIAVAAVVTREVVARSFQDDHREARAAVEQAVRREVARLEEGLVAAAGTLASREHPLVGGILSDLVKNGGALDANARRRLRQDEDGFMRGLGLDLLTVTGAGDEVLAAPHLGRAALGDTDAGPAELARALPGRAFFARDKIMGTTSLETVLVVEAAATVRDGGQRVALLVGRRIGGRVLDTVRLTGRVDARIVDPDGAVIVPAAGRWSDVAAGAPVRVALAGTDGAPVAWIEVGLADAGLDRLLSQVTFVSLALAGVALAITVLVGVLVARRLTRDLDRLVVGAQAAARGDLEHRVPAPSTDEVGEVAAAFNLMMEDLRSANEKLVIAERIAAWQEIARRLAHEIKNPLTPIQMAMDTLRKAWRKQHPSFGEIVEESTQSVLEEVERLKRIVSEFSDFARLPRADVAPCDVSEVVAGALALYVGAAPIEHRLAPDLPPIEADRGQLSQVLLNLVENARDAIAGKADGRIVVSTRKGDAGDRVELAVEDNGPGVAADRKDKVFAPYYTTKLGKGGTGLGLAIVHRIVSDHGGRISVGDAAGGGARFVVELPIRHGHSLLASRA
jgi:two-component system nitrogen regulation sensor histidine kinase NtrY